LFCAGILPLQLQLILPAAPSIAISLFTTVEASRLITSPIAERSANEDASHDEVHYVQAGSLEESIRPRHREYPDKSRSFTFIQNAVDEVGRSENKQRTELEADVNAA
jgi:hypothetical protein